MSFGWELVEGRKGAGNPYAPSRLNTERGGWLSPSIVKSYLEVMISELPCPGFFPSTSSPFYVYVRYKVCDSELFEQIIISCPKCRVISRRLHLTPEKKQLDKIFLKSRVTRTDEVSSQTRVAFYFRAKGIALVRSDSKFFEKFPLKYNTAQTALNVTHVVRLKDKYTSYNTAPQLITCCAIRLISCT